MTRPAPSAGKRRPVVLLTGFLGSGKTTLLKRLLADPRMARTAVVINELGEVGVDHLLVGRPSDDAVLLSNGCLCCAIKTDFDATLKDLHARAAAGELPEFDRVVVETTGIADPSNALRGLMTEDSLARHFKVHSIVTTVDTTIPLEPGSTRPERLRQIAAADRLVLTKTDLVDAATLDAWRTALRHLNAVADQVDVRDIDDIHATILDADATARLTTHELGLEVGHVGQHAGLLGGRAYAPPHAQVESFCLVADKPLDWSRLTTFLRELARRHSRQLLRIKGVLDVAGVDKPVVIQGVHQYLYPETHLAGWPGTERRSNIVLIVENVDRREVQDLFDRLVS